MKKYVPASILSFSYFSGEISFSNLTFRKILMHYPVKPTKIFVAFTCKHILLVFDDLNFISWLNNSLTKQSSTKRLNLLRTFPPQNITDGMNISKLIYLSLRRSIWNIEKRQTSINKFMGMLHKYFSKTGFIENNIFLTL